MKSKLNILWIALTIVVKLSFSNLSAKTRLAVLNFDVQNINYTPEQIGNMVRLEAEKLDTFKVVDRYDIAYLVAKNKINLANCYGKICLMEAGLGLGVEKVISGTVEKYSESIQLTIKLVDVSKGFVEKTYIKEFVDIPENIQEILRVGILETLEKPVDAFLVERLTQKPSVESIYENPGKSRLNLSGPRMGVAIFTGQTATILQRNTLNGGFDNKPVMFQFGYQFEKQYLNEGRLQALFEFIPTITGMDQNRVIPAFTILNGIRDNYHGWEFAIGPTFYFGKYANVYTDGFDYRLENNFGTDSIINNINSINQLDSRGKIRMKTGFVLAVGKSFRSGKLNFPVNFYIVPNKEGIRMGLSLGYNSKK